MTFKKFILKKTDACVHVYVWNLENDVDELFAGKAKNTELKGMDLWTQ